jgi:hypothetical protein
MNPKFQPQSVLDLIRVEGGLNPNSFFLSESWVSILAAAYMCSLFLGFEGLTTADG